MTSGQIIQELNTLGRSPVRSLSETGGSSFASLWRAELEDGSRWCLKTSPRNNDTFTTEARGLEELRSAGACRIPAVLTASSDLLVMEWIDTRSAASLPGFFPRFGAMFAQQHRKHAAMFGFHEDNYCGATPQKNLPQRNSWKEFYLLNRLEFQWKLAEQNGMAHRELAELFHRIERSIERLIPDDGEPPALLHGDLWSGNFLCAADGMPVLIDPAVYYGHREADLAMTLLFGGFSESFYRSYQEAYPLQEGWERRMELYKLYHLLNHLNLFGESYAAQVYTAMRTVLK